MLAHAIMVGQGLIAAVAGHRDAHERTSEVQWPVSQYE